MGVTHSLAILFTCISDHVLMGHCMQMDAHYDRSACAWKLDTDYLMHRSGLDGLRRCRRGDANGFDPSSVRAPLPSPPHKNFHFSVLHYTCFIT
jgi:hypothetical protein